ncbi:MAG: DM13 domain-containing protein [Candidatus Andersenbacteria bacterium]
MGGATKTIIGVVVVIGVAVGIWLAAPLFYDKEVNEELPGTAPTTQPTGGGSNVQTNRATPTAAAPAVATLAQGTFTGFDELHQAAGTARIVEADGKRYVRFDEDFTVTNGPDLYVYFGNNGEYDASTNIGRLKGNVGSQNYEIPDTINSDSYSEVWVWCRAFSVPFGKAVVR